MIQLFFTLIIKIFLTLITAETVLIMMVLFKTSLRKRAILGLDRLKRGRGLLVLKTIHGAIFLVLLYSVYSMIKIQKRTVDEVAINPTHQVLMAKHLLEASLIGFSMFLALMLDGLHNFSRELQLLGKDMEGMKKQKREAELEAKEKKKVLEDEVTFLKKVIYRLQTAVDVKTEDVMALKEKVNQLEIECEVKTKNVLAGETSIMALKKQSEGLLLEYDRLLEDNQNLRNQLRSIDRRLSHSDYKKNT